MSFSTFFFVVVVRGIRGGYWLKNTTPTWSVRHKLRTQVVPLIEEVFTGSVYDNLFLLAERNEKMYKYIKTNVINVKAVQLNSGSLFARSSTT